MKVPENRLKIIIDISEELYRYITGETYDEHLDRRFDFMIRHTVRNGEVLSGESGGTPSSKTNGDRIRAMTDEELVDLLLWNVCNVCDGRGYKLCGIDSHCKEHVAKWLKQEVSEDDIQ